MTIKAEAKKSQKARPRMPTKDWIPACAGMTEREAGMTKRVDIPFVILACPESRPRMAGNKYFIPINPNKNPAPSSPSGYWTEISFLHFRHFPCKASHETIGILSCQGIFFSHLGQNDLPPKVFL